MRLIVAILASLLVLCSAVAQPSRTDDRAVAEKALGKLGRGVDGIALKGVDGKVVRLRDFDGAPRVLFFGFTRCPVVCPVTVWELDAALESIGASAKDVGIVFITLDPARDTPAVMQNYFSGFKGRVTPLTAPLPVIKRMAKAYDVRFERVDTGKGDYSIDHTALAFLVNAEGRVVDTIAFGASRDVSVTRLKALIQAGKRQDQARNP